jgi:hypothetical protein
VIALPVVTTVGVICYGSHRFSNRLLGIRSLSRFATEEEVVNSTYEAIDDPDDLDDITRALQHVPPLGGAQVVRVPVPETLRRIVGYYAGLARMELNCSKHNTATEQVVRDWALRTMRKDYLRNKDISRALPLVVVYAFIPSKYDLAARVETTSVEYQKRYLLRDINMGGWFPWSVKEIRAQRG